MGRRPGSARSPAPPRRRSSPGCRRGARGRPTAAWRRAGSRSASPWGTAGGSAGRSCARSASPSRRRAPSRRKKEPGILPAAYCRSSTSTVRGRKSTSRRLPIVAVQRTIVSPDADDDRAARLPGELAGLEGDLARRRPPPRRGLRQTCSFSFLPPAARLAANLLQNSRSLSQRVTGRRSRSRPPSTAAVANERRGPGDPGRGSRTRSRAAPARRPRVGAAVGLEALEVEPEALGPLPEMRVVDLAAVGVDRVDHLEERALAARPPPRPRAAPARAGACWRPGSGGRRGRGAARGSAPRRRRSAGSRGRGRRSAPAPRRALVVAGPTGGTPALVELRHVS